MYESHNSAHVMRSRFLIEKFVPELIHLPGVNNVVADCLSRLHYINKDNKTDHFALDEEEVNAYPLSYKLIMKYKQKYNNPFKKVKTTQRIVYVPSILQDVHIP